MLSPYAGLLRSGRVFSTSAFQTRGEYLKRPTTVEDFLRDFSACLRQLRLKPGSLFVWVEDSLELVALNLKSGLSADQTLIELRAGVQQILKDVGGYGLGIKLRGRAELNIYRPTGELHSRLLPAFRSHPNIYSVALRAGETLWGEDFFLGSFRQSYGEEPASSPNLLGKPYAVVNLDVGGIEKQERLRHPTFLPSLLEEVLVEISRQQYDGAIFLNLPAEHSFESLAPSLRNRVPNQLVNLKTQPLEAWPKILARSSGLVSWDTGMVHMANMVGDPGKVLTMNFSLGTSPSVFWSLPANGKIDEWNEGQDYSSQTSARSKLRDWIRSHF